MCGTPTSPLAAPHLLPHALWVRVGSECAPHPAPTAACVAWAPACGLLSTRGHRAHLNTTVLLAGVLLGRTVASWNHLLNLRRVRMGIARLRRMHARVLILADGEALHAHAYAYAYARARAQAHARTPTPAPTHISSLFCCMEPCSLARHGAALIFDIKLDEAPHEVGAVGCRGGTGGDGGSGGGRQRRRPAAGPPGPVPPCGALHFHQGLPHHAGGAHAAQRVRRLPRNGGRAGGTCSRSGWSSSWSSSSECHSAAGQLLVRSRNACY